LLRSRKAALAAALLALAGCATEPAVPPLYPGHLNEPTNLAYVEEGGVRVGVPPGWKLAPRGRAPGTLRADLRRDDGTSILVFCNDPKLSRADEAAEARKSVQRPFETVERFRGPFSLFGAAADPVIEGYNGVIARQGKKVQLWAFVAWNIDIGAKDCRYQIVAFANQLYAGRLEPDFVAVVRSLFAVQRRGRVQLSDQARQQLDAALPKRSCANGLPFAAFPFTESCALRAGMKVL
jgi:hypothetical protein